jgi:hypothetical protein
MEIGTFELLARNAFRMKVTLYFLRDQALLVVRPIIRVLHLSPRLPRVSEVCTNLHEISSLGESSPANCKTDRAEANQ